LSAKDFERCLSELRADSRTEALLRIMEDQVNNLVREGRTDPALFLSSLESNNILSFEQVSELRAKFLEGVGQDSFPRSLVLDVSDNEL
jgi:hypothetical protein